MAKLRSEVMRGWHALTPPQPGSLGHRLALWAHKDLTQDVVGCAEVVIAARAEVKVLTVLAAWEVRSIGEWALVVRHHKVCVRRGATRGEGRDEVSIGACCPRASA
jgi:hypothetical protein